MRLRWVIRIQVNHDSPEEEYKRSWTELISAKYKLMIFLAVLEQKEQGISLLVEVDGLELMDDRGKAKILFNYIFCHSS